MKLYVIFFGISVIDKMGNPNFQKEIRASMNISQSVKSNVNNEIAYRCRSTKAMYVKHSVTDNVLFVI